MGVSFFILQSFRRINWSAFDSLPFQGFIGLAPPERAPITNFFPNKKEFE